MIRDTSPPRAPGQRSEPTRPETIPGNRLRDHTVAPVTLDPEESTLPEGSQAPRDAADRGRILTILAASVAVLVAVGVGVYFFGWAAIPVGIVLAAVLLYIAVFPHWNAARLRKKDEVQMNEDDRRA